MRPLGPGSLSTLLDSLLLIAWIGGWVVVVAFVLVPLTGGLGADVFLEVEVDTTSGHPPLAAAGPGGTWRVEPTRTKLSAPPSCIWIASLLVLPFLALYLLVVRQLRAIFRSLRHGSPFVPENARRLRSIGLTVLGFEGLRLAVTLAVVRPRVARLHIEGISLRGDVSLDWQILFLGLALLVLAEVFRRGTVMREELELTV